MGIVAYLNLQCMNDFVYLDEIDHLLNLTFVNNGEKATKETCSKS